MKILIIGSVASGKTTFTKDLSKETNINYYEIDSIVHDDINSKKRTPKEQKIIIDKIIYLDIPLNTRKKRIITRFIKQKLKLEKSNYKPDFKILKDMFKWTNDFEENKNTFENRLNKYKNKVIVIKEINKTTLQEVKSYL